MKDYYEILDAPIDAEFDQLKAQYRRMVRIYHPDRFQSVADKEYAEHKLKEINEAFATLSNPEAKREYDRRLLSIRAARQPAPDFSERPPRPVVTPDALDFGLLPANTSLIKKFRVDNVGGPANGFSFAYSEQKPWFRVIKGERINDEQPFPMEIQVQASTRGLEPHMAHHGWIEVYLDGVPARIVLSVEVGEPRKPKPIVPKFAVAALVMIVLVVASVSLLTGTVPLPTLSASLTRNSVTDSAQGGPTGADWVLTPVSDRLSFIVYENGQPQLVLSQADGGNQTLLPLSGRSPTWAPSKTQLAYIADHDEGAQLVLVDLQTGVPHQLTDTPEGKTALVWSPTEQHLAFLAGDEGQRVLEVVDIGNNLLQILTTAELGSVEHFVWSPDGRSLAFDLVKDNESHVYQIRVTGEDLRRITSLPAQGPAWSPDGNRLAVASERGLYTMDGEGRDLRRLTSYGGQSPQWSSDGRQIAFVTAHGAQDGDPDLWAVDAQGRNLEHLSELNCLEHLWLPDDFGIACVTGSSLGRSPSIYYLWRIVPGAEPALIAEVGEPHISWVR